MIPVKDAVPKPKKCLRMFVNACIVTMLICALYYAYCQRYSREMTAAPDIRSLTPTNSTCLPSNGQKILLLWTPYFSDIDWLPSTRDLGCPNQECFATSDRSLLPNSSAIIMHWRNIDTKDLPDSTIPNSFGKHPILVIFNKESPTNTPSEKIDKLNDRIHWIASYRKDSDVYAPYGKVTRRKDVFKMPEFNPDQTLVCWLVSHCQTSSSREVYVNKLRQYIDVKIYGRCGDNACPHALPLDCYRWLSKRCKFYISFENSICKDYSTEKLYYAMMTDMVPIVMGGDDYSRYLPAHSFIDVKDFSSPKALAAHLVEVGGDAAKYLAYFKWKRFQEVSFVPYSWYCDLCAKLHQTNHEDVRTHADLRRWWYDDAHCGS